MALTINADLESGIKVDKAYVRVEYRNGINKQPMTFSVGYYLDRNAFTNGKQYLKQEFYTFTPSATDDAPNDVKQCYEYLKTLPEFSGAIDVIE